MSHIGNKKIQIPNNVFITLTNNQLLVIGKYGSLERSLSNSIIFKLENNTINLVRINNLKKTREYHGLINVLIKNMIIGVNNQFSKSLITEGIGYKFQLKDLILVVNVGYTHVIEFVIPLDITLIIESPTKIVLSGINKEKVTLLASKIRAIRPPEPYNGKGILYLNEKVIKKIGKTGK